MGTLDRSTQNKDDCDAPFHIASALGQTLAQGTFRSVLQDRLREEGTNEQKGSHDLPKVKHF